MLQLRIVFNGYLLLSLWTGDGYTNNYTRFLLSIHRAQDCESRPYICGTINDSFGVCQGGLVNAQPALDIKIGKLQMNASTLFFLDIDVSILWNLLF